MQKFSVKYFTVKFKLLALTLYADYTHTTKLPVDNFKISKTCDVSESNLHY